MFCRICKSCAEFAIFWRRILTSLDMSNTQRGQECCEPSGKCQGILHCLESGHPVRHEVKRLLCMVMLGMIWGNGLADDIILVCVLTLSLQPRAVLFSAQVSSAGEPAIGLKRYGQLRVNPQLGVKELSKPHTSTNFVPTMPRNKVCQVMPF